MSRPTAASRSRALRAVASLTVALVVASGLAAAGPAQAALPVPPTPAGLTRAIEAPQPYVGQSICDPVAKPGVAAFRDLLLRTYTDSGSLGIVKDCGLGGQSEHKEGRAFDWAVSVNNANQVAEVNALFAWLLATDRYGNTYAMAKRLGIMYMIWNHQMWRAYDNGSWRAYTGDNPHTDHVHFSFGWNGAKKTTSYWDGTVAPIDYGPAGQPWVTPVRSPGNLSVLRDYGQLNLGMGSAGEAVATLQRGLQIPADGSYGNQTAAAVSSFQARQGLTDSGSWGPPSWQRLFPPPVNPFGQWNDIRTTPGGTLVTGWVVDADTIDPVSVTLTVDGAPVGTSRASTYRPDVAASYPDSGASHGYSVVLTIASGTHQVCVTGVNAPGTPGANTALGCRSVVVRSGAFGAFESATQVLETIHVKGWALDTATANPVQVRVAVDGAVAETVTANVARPDVGAQWKGFGDAHGYALALPLTQGAHTVCVTALQVSEAGATALGCQLVAVRHNAIGGFGEIYQVPAGTYARGWGLDPDSVSPVNVVLSVDGRRIRQVSANITRADVAAAYPTNGGNHGWATTWNVEEGTHQVCAFVANAAGTPGVESLIGCRSLVVRHSPVGQLAAVRTIPGGGVVVAGWEIDPDSASVGQVEIWVDGARTTTLAAGGTRPDIGASHPGYGAAHGFIGNLALAAGRHTVCAFGVNTPGTLGTRTAFGCLGVVVSSTVGAFEAVKGSTGVLEARGWAIDPDLADPIQVWGYVDGNPLRSALAYRPRSDIGARWPGYGDGHGWVLTIAVPAGPHLVCVTAINASGTPGDRTSLGCRQVTVS